MTDLAELMSRDPRGYSQKDLEDVIKFYREKRHQYNLGNLKAGSTKPKSEKEKEVLSLSDKLDLKL